MLSKVISPNQKNWDEVLLLVFLAYRSFRHGSTGFPSSLLMFGRKFELLLDLLSGFPRQIEPLSHNEYVIHIINKNHQVAFEEMSHARDKQNETMT